MNFRKVVKFVDSTKKKTTYFKKRTFIPTFARKVSIKSTVKTFLILLFMHTTLLAQIQSRAYKATIDALCAESVPYVSCEALKKETAQLLDCREKPEFTVSHLPEATWIGYDDFSLERVAHLDKSRPIVVYCSVGYRSEKIGEKLLVAGFKNVKNLYGGIFEWVNQNNGVITPKRQPTTRVHAYNRAWGVWLRKGERVYE